MAIKRGKLEFHNVIVMHTRCTYGDWKEKAMEFRAFLIQNEIFITGPILVRWDNINEDTKEADLELYLPTHQKLQMEENEVFSVIEHFCIEDGIKIRHNDMEDSIRATEALLEVTSQKAELKLQKPYYYIYLPVYQEYIVDIYAPIEKGEQV